MCKQAPSILETSVIFRLTKSKSTGFITKSPVLKLDEFPEILRKIIHFGDWRLPYDILHSDDTEKLCWNSSLKRFGTEQFSVPKFSNISALAIKNWITMRRSPVLFIFIFLLPGIIMSLTCISIGIDPVNLPFGVLNLETNCSGVNLSVSKIFSLITMMHIFWKYFNCQPQLKCWTQYFSSDGDYTHLQVKSVAK